MIVTVLGTEYRIHESSPAEDPVLKDNDGYCDPSVAVCVIAELDKRESDSLYTTPIPTPRQRPRY